MASRYCDGTNEIIFYDQHVITITVNDEPEEPAKFQYYSEAVDRWLPFNACEIIAELEEGNEIKYRVN